MPDGGVWLDEAYRRRMTGMGRDYTDRQRERVRCPECSKYMERGSLATYCQTQNDMTKGVPVQE